MSVNPTPAPSADEQRVLLLPPTSRDGDAIAALLTKAGIACTRMATTAGLCAALDGGGAGVLLISEEALADGADVLAACVVAQPVWSDLPMLVLARSGSESPRLAAALARLGNVSIVERPVRMNTLLSLIRRRCGHADDSMNCGLTYPSWPKRNRHCARERSGIGCSWTTSRITQSL